eukprot:s9054_g4.t1
MDVGSDALVRLPVDEVRDPSDPNIVVQRAIPSGVQALCKALPVGSDALVRLPVDEVRDPSDPNIVVQRAIPSGVQALCKALPDAFGLSDHEMVSRSIEDFFEFRRGKMTFQEYSTEWDRRLEEATTRAGLDLNDNEVDANLTTKFVDDIKLQLQGGLEKDYDYEYEPWLGEQESWYESEEGWPEDQTEYYEEHPDYHGEIQETEKKGTGGSPTAGSADQS